MSIVETPSSQVGADKKKLDIVGICLTALTLVFATIWAFPLYWALVTTLKPESQVIRPYIELWPETLTFDAYWHVLNNTGVATWYLNSVVTSGAITFLVVGMGMMAGYALSQLRFPGRKILWMMIIASFMVPTQALIVNHFVLMADAKMLNSWAGIIVPQLIVPMVVIVYKQFFDQVPKDFREAALMDNADEIRMLFKIYLPMNWGITTALAIITFIGAWNSFFWPFLAAQSESQMTIPVGITQVADAFGVQYARQMAAAVMAGAPVALIYLLFQRKVTQAIMLSAGIKG